MREFDLFVIGAGSGGVRAARLAAQAGMRVAIAEHKHWGGTCVNVGCIPKKLLVYAGEFSKNIGKSEGYGWCYGEVTFNWQTLIENKNKEIERLNTIYTQLLIDKGVTLLNGKAIIESNNKVHVGDKCYQCKHILIATGGSPVIPNIVGSDLAITSDQVFFLQHLPKSIAIVGSGYISLEFASIFNNLGVDVHVIYRGSRLLKQFDVTVSSELETQMRSRGITFCSQSVIKEIRRCNSTGELLSTIVTTDKKSSTQRELVTEQALYAIGRNPATEGLCKELFIDKNKNGFIKVDNNFQTSQKDVYAIGDVIGNKALTPVAITEAMHCVDYLLTGKKVSMEYNNIATAVFTSPQLATVGYSEEEVKQRNIPAKVYTTSFRELKNTLTPVIEKIVMKLIVNADSDQILGAHMLGGEAAEILQIIAVAIAAGATKTHFDKTIGVHPTLAEEWVTMYQETYTI